jgi:hypothetical protein
MDSDTEKYPVCPERNTAAAFRWFYQPASALAFLKARTTPRPPAAHLLPGRSAAEHAVER